jgi:catechol 2,3-dioxygenase-like lactoylglutathione lyase family enzyme
MIDHMGITVSDYPKSKAFYDAVFAALGGSLLQEIPLQFTGGKHVAGYGRDHAVFWITEGTAEKGSHYAFNAADRAQVQAFYDAALRSGGTDNGGPGLRPHYHADYYGAFVIDPDGNNVEAVCHRPE